MRQSAALPVVGALLFAAACADGPTGLTGAPDSATLLWSATGDEQIPTVTTDKDDYQPGDVVTITGSGWWAGESVHLHITEDPPAHPDHNYYVDADENGDFVHAELVMDADHLGVAFTLTATGLSSGLTAGTTFTDGAPIVNFFTLDATTFTFPTPPPANQAAENPITVSPGATVTLVVNATTVSQGANPATWKSTEVQFKGGSIDFGDAPALCNDDDVVNPANVTTTDHTLTFSAPVAANTYDVRVRAYQDDGCTGLNGSETYIGVLIVEAASPTDDDPPEVLAIGADPNPVAIDGAVLITATISDEDAGGSDVVEAQYRISMGPFDSGWLDFDAFTPGVTVNVSATADLAALGVPEAGLFDLCVRGKDEHDNQSDGTDCITLVVYDPSAGFVTGGGWIASPAGAYREDLDLTGKAHFGFVSKYQKGKNTPDGSTQFQFQAGGLNFHSNTYEWLVVNQSGTNAQFKGVGTINGEGAYMFMLWATDGETDLFRIKIWEENGGETVIYDNNGEQALGGGSIVIQTGGKGKK